MSHPNYLLHPVLHIHDYFPKNYQDHPMLSENLFHYYNLYYFQYHLMLAEGFQNYTQYKKNLKNNYFHKKTFLLILKILIQKPIVYYYFLTRQNLNAYLYNQSKKYLLLYALFDFYFYQSVSILNLLLNFLYYINLIHNLISIRY